MTGILGAGGEEWRTFEQQGGYDPNRWTDSVRTARQRIDAVRCKDVELVLHDRAGRPLADREVHVVQQRSDFAWGFGGWGYLTQLHDGTFDQWEHLHRRKLQTGICNAINLMHYWAEKHCTNAPISEEHQGHVDYDLVDRAIQWARGEGLGCKGHPIYWPVPKAIPDWVLRYDVETRRKFLEVRVRQLVARFKGRMSWYDAVNEMMWETTLGNVENRHWPHMTPLEEIADEAADVLRWAREEDPDCCYLLNEYGIAKGETEEIPIDTSDGRRISRDQQLQRYIALGRLMAERGQAPDALGMQTAPGDWDDLPRLADTLDAIGEGTGQPVHITEFRTGVKHLVEAGVPEAEFDERMAEYLCAALTVSFGNPHCEGFWFWGDMRMWHGRKPTVVYRQVQELIRERWMTDVTLRSDAEGRVRFRGFSGEYAVRVARASGQVSGRRFAVPAAALGPVVQQLRLALVEA